MPRGDRTGPEGMGPMTGRAAGYCAGFGVPGYANPIPGRGIGGRGRGFGAGYGRGRGFGGGGRGWRNWFHTTGLPGWLRFGGGAFPPPATNPDWERSALQSEADALQSELDAIKKRLSEIEAGTKKESAE